MQKLLLTAIVTFFSCFSSFAQNIEPVPAPADVLLNFTTENDRHQFHLGEFIPITYSYAATTPGKYAWVVSSSKIVGSRGLQVTCSPAADPPRLPPWLAQADRAAKDKFDEMLNPLCPGAGRGMGGSAGGVFGCCDGEGGMPLGNTPLGFGVLPLNLYVRFRSPGRYSCVASSAEVTTASSKEEPRQALLVKSKPLDLEIVDDPTWSRSAAATYAIAYDKSCRGNDLPERNFLQCSNTSQQITYLDTADSLAVEVKFFDGKNHGWDNGFWDAILHTSYPVNAVRLMTARIQDPAVEVSTSTLEWLASAALRLDLPEAFETSSPAKYHAQAVEKMRKFVRSLGSSLSAKESGVLPESVKTYSFFADQKNCEGHPLVPKQERDRVLTDLKPSTRKR